MVNEALATSTSPYLQSHAHQPVEWQLWTPAAFAQARKRDVPVFVSIGYATCHWCHVMAAESFSDPVTAQMLNNNFVCIKVDREELPSVDAYYMDALQGLRGQGGWPLHAFVDHTGMPFYAGTYFPPVAKGGVPAFSTVLQAVVATWRDQREQVINLSNRLGSALNHMREDQAGLPTDTDSVSPMNVEELERAYEQIGENFDAEYGGFGGAPKFSPTLVLHAMVRSLWRRRAELPAPGSLELWAAGIAFSSDMLRTDILGEEISNQLGNADIAAGTDASGAGRADLFMDDTHSACGRLHMVRSTLLHIISGGMRDQLRGGIARYSTDTSWTVPHFEKMLADNAVYLRLVAAWLNFERGLDPESPWALLALRETLDTGNFIIRDLRTDSQEANPEECALGSGLDADSPLHPEPHPDFPDQSREPVAGHCEGAFYTFSHTQLLRATIGKNSEHLDSFYGIAHSPGGGLFALAPTAEDLGAHGKDDSREVLTAPGLKAWVMTCVRARAADLLAGDECSHRPQDSAPWNDPAALRVRAQLERIQKQRIPPRLDEKSLTAESALAATALLEAGAATKNTDFLVFGRTLVGSLDAHFVDNSTIRAGAKTPPASSVGLVRSRTHERPGPALATLADVAAVALAQLTLGQCLPLFAGDDQRELAVRTGERIAEVMRYISEHLIVTETDVESGPGSGMTRLYDSPADAVAGFRLADPIDGAIPCGRSLLAEVAHSLALLSPDAETAPAPGQAAGMQVTGVHPPVGAKQLLGSLAPIVKQAPRGSGWGLAVAERMLSVQTVRAQNPAQVYRALQDPSGLVVQMPNPPQERG